MSNLAGRRARIATMAWEVSQQGMEGARTIERMNRDNNSLWRWVSGAAAVAGFAAIPVVAMLFLASGGESSD